MPQAMPEAPTSGDMVPKQRWVVVQPSCEPMKSSSVRGGLRIFSTAGPSAISAQELKRMWSGSPCTTPAESKRHHSPCQTRSGSSDPKRRRVASSKAGPPSKHMVTKTPAHTASSSDVTGARRMNGAEPSMR